MLVGATTNSTNNPYSACIIYTDADGHSQWSHINATLADHPTPPVNGNFHYYSIAKKTNGNFVILGYLDNAGIVRLSIKGDGHMTELGIGGGVGVTNKINYVIPVIQGGFAYVGYSNGTIYLSEEYAYLIGE